MNSFRVALIGLVVIGVLFVILGALAIVYAKRLSDESQVQPVAFYIVGGILAFSGLFKLGLGWAIRRRI
jgi:hypothetical protein